MRFGARPDAAADRRPDQGDGRANRGTAHLLRSPGRGPCRPLGPFASRGMRLALRLHDDRGPLHRPRTGDALTDPPHDRPSARAGAGSKAGRPRRLHARWSRVGRADRAVAHARREGGSTRGDHRRPTAFFPAGCRARRPDRSARGNRAGLLRVLRLHLASDPRSPPSERPRAGECRRNAGRFVRSTA